jgi:DNA-binding beta-propeller fold protein YncE
VAETRTPLEQYLWQIGLLNAEKQAALDALRFGSLDNQTTGTAILFDERDYRIRLRPVGTDGSERYIELPKPGDKAHPTLTPKDPGIAMFGVDNRKIGDYPIESEVGLLLSGGECFRFASAYRHAHHLPVMRVAHSPAIGQAGNGYGPVDISLGPDGSDLLVVDRGLGAMQHVDLATGELGERFTMRPKGSTSILNVAWNRQKVLISDSRALGLVVCDLLTGESGPTGLALGTIGNIVMSPDGLALYVLTLAPHFMVHVLDPDTFDVLDQFVLKGRPFSTIGEPTDLMMIAPDGRSLLVMSYVDVPVKHTPVLNVIDPVARQVNHRYRLNPERKPIGLALGLKNPFFTVSITVEAALVKLGYLKLDALEQVTRQMAEQQQRQAGVQFGADLASVTSLEDIAGGYTWRRTTAEPAKQIHLPASIERLLMDYLHMRFAIFTGLQFRDDTAAYARVLKTVAHLRLELESSSGVEVELRDLMHGRDLTAFISREMVLEWLPILERDDLMKGINVRTVPDRCPDCKAPLFGVFVCPVCGFEVQVNSRDLLDPQTLSPATMHPGAFLPQNHLLVPDPLHRRLVELDEKRQIFWEVKADSLHQELEHLLRWPADCFRLPNRHTLVADASTGRVFEVTRLGRPYWEWPVKTSPLMEPVKVTRSEWGDTWVVDRKGHQILRVSGDNSPMPGYGSGEPGREPGQLNQPGDLQVLPNGNLLIADTGNNRIIEVHDGRVIWTLGDSDDLRLLLPRRLHRFDNGLTVIVDSGHHRILAVDRHGQLVWSHDTVMSEGIEPMARPLGMFPLSEGRFVYWDTHWVIEVDTHGALLWSSSLDDLAFHGRLVQEQGEEARGNRSMPRRLWEINRLKDDDPDEVAARIAQATRRKRAKQWRESAWKERQEAVIQALRAESKRRLAEYAEAAKERNQGVRPRMTAMPTDLAPRKARPTPDERPPERPAGPPAPIEPEATPFKPFEEVFNQIISVKGAVRGPGRRDKAATDVITVQRNSDQIVWFVRGHGIRWSWGAGQLKRPRDAHLIDHRYLLVTDTMNHRVLQVDTLTNRIVWQVGKEVRLQFPRAARKLPNGNVLIADTGNRRVVEVTTAGEIVWHWDGRGSLKTPNYVERLANGNTLVTDWHDHVVMEIDGRGDIAWWYGEPGQAGSGAGLLNFPEAAMRVAPDRTLIVDGHNDRLIEVDGKGRIKWEYRGEAGSRLNWPTAAQRDAEGNTMIIHRFGKAAIEVGPDGAVLWQGRVPGG